MGNYIECFEQMSHGPVHGESRVDCPFEIRCVKTSLAQLGVDFMVQELASVDGPLKNIGKDHKVC